MVTPNKSIYTAEQAMQWLGQIADALAYMHALNPTVSMCVYALTSCFWQDFIQSPGLMAAMLSN